MTLVGKVEASTGEIFLIFMTFSNELTVPGLLMNMTETLQPFLSDISAVISET